MTWHVARRFQRPNRKRKRQPTTDNATSTIVLCMTCMQYLSYGTGYAMDHVTLGKSIERQLRFTESIASVSTPEDATYINEEFAKTVHDLMYNTRDIQEDMSRQGRIALSKKKARGAQAWLDAYQRTDVFRRLKALLAGVPDRAAAVASPSNSPVCRCARTAQRVSLGTTKGRMMHFSRSRFGRITALTLASVHVWRYGCCL